MIVVFALLSGASNPAGEDGGDAYRVGAQSLRVIDQFCSSTL